MRRPQIHRPPRHFSTTSLRRPARHLLRMAAVTASLLPRMSLPAFSYSARWVTFHTRIFSPRLLPALSLAVPGVSLNLPALLGDIWESVLRAVPKKKTSHAKKRHRQMAGKALEDVHGLCECSGCGATKRSHRLCQNCLRGQFIRSVEALECFSLTQNADMRQIWRENDSESANKPS